jgi:hypothetical protein
MARMCPMSGCQGTSRMCTQEKMLASLAGLVILAVVGVIVYLV